MNVIKWWSMRNARCCTPQARTVRYEGWSRDVNRVWEKNILTNFLLYSFDTPSPLKIYFCYRAYYRIYVSWVLLLEWVSLHCTIDRAIALMFKIHTHRVPESTKWMVKKVLKLIVWIFMISKLPLNPWIFKATKTN